MNTCAHLICYFSTSSVAYRQVHIYAQWVHLYIMIYLYLYYNYNNKQENQLHTTVVSFICGYDLININTYYYK